MECVKSVRPYFVGASERRPLQGNVLLLWFWGSETGDVQWHGFINSARVFWGVNSAGQTGEETEKPGQLGFTEL